MSPIADNLTTALVLAAVALAVGHGSKKFVALSCINIVVAAMLAARSVPLATSQR